MDQVVALDALGVEAGRDPLRLRRYLETLAIHTAEVVDDVTLYKAAGINKITARAYHRLLQNLLMVDDVPAWTTNRLKRLTLAPKHHLGVVELTRGAGGRVSLAAMRPGPVRPWWVPVRRRGRDHAAVG